MVQDIWCKNTQYNGKDIKDTQTYFSLSSPGIAVDVTEEEPTAAPAAATSGVNLEELSKDITAAGEKVKELKTSKADKAAIDAAVKVLLEKKQLYADNNNGIGVDGKPFGGSGGKKKKGGGGGGGNQQQQQVCFIFVRYLGSSYYLRPCFWF